MGIRFWAVFALGITAGAAVALMYAPEKGYKMRRKVKHRLNEASDYIHEHADEYGDAAAKVYQRASGKVQEFASVAKERASGLV